MWLVIGVSVILLVCFAVWFRNRWIVDTFDSWGPYSTMAGFYLYRKYGLWHIGTYEDNPVKEIKSKEASKPLIAGELDLKLGYTR